MTALITGSSSELGFSILNEFLKNDINVIGLYNQNLPKIDDTRVRFIHANFQDLNSIDNIIENIFIISKKIRYLVNCAGVIENKSIYEINLTDINKIYNINVFFHFLLMQQIYKNMEENNFGRIVSLSSIGVKYAGSPTSILYSSSKLSLEALTRSYAKLGAEKNILCNNIRVGVIDTKIHSKKDMEFRKSLIPLKKLGKSEDISKFVLYLCLSSGDFITGQNISISGGE